MMKEIIRRTTQIFYFSPAEARGFAIILGGLLFVLLAWVAEEWHFSNKAQPLTLSVQQLDSVVVLLNEKKTPQNTYQEEPTLSNINPIPFDPNTANIAELQNVGIPKFLAERIEKYRSKGGKFRKKEDLQRIYDFPPRLYQQLETYIQLPENSYQPSENSYSLQKNNYQISSKEANSEESKPERLTKFDLNTADTTILKRINGIGSGYAKRILKFRDALGGFVYVEQVRETFGLPPETADELLKYAILRTPPRKININSATVEQLDAHPYINKTQAKVIVAYRQQHEAFKSTEDLKNIKVLETAAIEKISAYLIFD